MSTNIHEARVSKNSGDFARQAFRAFQCWASEALESAGRTRYFELSPGAYAPMKTLSSTILRFPEGALWSENGKIYADGVFEIDGKTIAASLYWRQRYTPDAFIFNVSDDGTVSVAYIKREWRTRGNAPPADHSSILADNRSAVRWQTVYLI